GGKVAIANNVDHAPEVFIVNCRCLLSTGVDESVSGILARTFRGVFANNAFEWVERSWPLIRLARQNISGKPENLQVWSLTEPKKRRSRPQGALSRGIDSEELRTKAACMSHATIE